MDIKSFAMIFGAVFLAELGDKTQIATINFAASERNAWMVFAASAAALLLSAAIGTAVGATLSQLLNPRHLSIAAGVAFIAIGVWTLVSALR
jgi:putative Ca2+/H+ antiporter (TMEM165/GDT1 family)